MHDAMSLESLGVPTAVIVTSEFMHEAKLQRSALGMEALVPAVIAHPLSSLTDADIRARALDAAPQLKAVWAGSQADP